MLTATEARSIAQDKNVCGFISPQSLEIQFVDWFCSYESSFLGSILRWFVASINESCVTHRLRDFEPSKEEKERQGDTERRLSGMTDPKDEPEPGRKDKEVSYRVNCLYSL